MRLTSLHRAGKSKGWVLLLAWAWLGAAQGANANDASTTPDASGKAAKTALHRKHKARHRHTNAPAHHALKLAQAKSLKLAAMPQAPQTPQPSQQDDAQPDSEAVINSLRDETQALRAETERLNQQYDTEKTRFESMHHESLVWIRSLIALLLLCMAALGWVLWRLYAMKKTASVAWNEVFSDTSSTHFDTTASLTATTFRPTALYNSDFEFTHTAALAAPTEVADDDATHEEKAAAPEGALNAEDISDVMELAEAWIALRDPSGVAKLLEPFGQIEQPQSPLPLLCLLDVYRSLGDRAKYDAIHKRVKALFNVRLASWEETEHPPVRTLADYPHVHQQILALWDKDEIVPYFDNLVLDTRNGTREGFDLHAYRDILQLKTIAGNPATRGKAGSEMHPKAYAILFAPAASEVPVTMENSAAQPPADSVDDDIDLHEEMSPMAIKLHLAVAYKDIGDREGACLLLEEVIQDGTTEQVAEAKKLLAGLGAMASA
jgi:FimV-like protein